MCAECFPSGYQPSEGDMDDHVVLRRGDRVRLHTTNGMTGNAEVLNVGRAAVRFEMLSMKVGDNDQALPSQLEQFVVVVPWAHITSLHIDPLDPWPDERKFLRKMARKYPQHFEGDDRGQP